MAVKIKLLKKAKINNVEYKKNTILSVSESIYEKLLSSKSAKKVSK